MSRIGQLPIVVPTGVSVEINGCDVLVKGPKGEIRRSFRDAMKLEINDGVLTVQRPSDTKEHRSLHGLTRSLLNNMVQGVSEGFTRELEIRGVGYKAEERSGGVTLTVGYSHRVEYDSPGGIKISVEGNNRVKVTGIDKELVGQVASELRKVRPPEPYKGKGIRYVGEHVRSKVGKTGAKQ